MAGSSLHDSKMTLESTQAVLSNSLSLDPSLGGTAPIAEKGLSVPGPPLQSEHGIKPLTAAPLDQAAPAAAIVLDAAPTTGALPNCGAKICNMAANVGAHVTTGLNKSAAFARQGCRHIVGSKIFERGVLALILANCITLVLYNPMDPRCETTQCKRLKSCEISFSSLAFLECLVRITALGFKGFWSDAWNRLDLAIVTCGIIDFIPGVNSGSIKAFRTTRVLRPLRVVKRFPSLRILVRLLLDIIPMLGSVMVLCIFLFVTFGITSVQLWKGVLRNGCYNNDGGRYQPSTGGFYICSLEADDGMNACPADVQFTGVYASNYTECRRGSPNYQNGALSFDNIWMSFLAIFQVVTLEDWTGVMYALQDGYSFWVWPFFVLLIFFGSWFAINLALVVIATQFKVTKKRETLLIRAHEADAGYSASQPRQLWPEFFLWTCSVVSCGRLSADVYRQRNNGVAIRAQQASDEELEDLQMIKEVFDLLDKDRDGTISLKELRGALHTLDNHLAKTEVKELVKSIDENGDGHIDFDEFCQLMGCSLGGDQRATVARNTPGPPAESDPAQPTACKATFRARVQQVVDHRLFTRVVVFCIAANTLSMAAEHHGQPDELAQSVETTNSVFAFIFFAEVVLRVISVGPLTYFIDGFNVCDGIIVIMGIVEVFVPSGGFNVLRSFRLMRLFKLARYLPTMQKQLLVMLRTLDSVLNFLLLLGLFIFMFAVMGMHLFGGNWEDYSSSQVSQPRQNFDSFLYSILTVFQVLTTEEWNLLLYHTMHASSKYAALYYVILITIGTFILVNLFVAIMVEGFATDPEAIARFRAALERARDVFHTMQNKPEYDTPLEEEHVQRATSELSHQSMHTHKSSQEASVVCIPEERHRPNSAAEKPWCWPLCTSKVSPQCSSANSAISVEVPRDFEKQAPAVSPSLARQHQPCNWVTQRRCKKIMDSRMFNVSLMIVLCVDTIVMCVERPSIAEGSSERVVLNGIDVMCETIFTLEAIVKMFALGVRHHRNSYFKDKWNVYDLSLLVCSWSLLAIRYSGSHSDAATTTMWILQIYRTFRPFRLVQRIPSLKQTLRMLLMSVRPIGNLLLMGSVFYIIFAIWGVQMFKGGFFFCSLETVNTGDPRICQSAQSAAYNTTRWASNQTVSIADSNDSFGNDSNCSVSSYLVENEHDCKVAGGVWNRRQYNFDNVWEALVTLFVVSSRDGWTEIMRNGVDSVGAERHPQKDANLTAIVYFVTFLLIVGYFVISMFVGVIVENFQLSMPSNTISDDGDEEEGGSDSGKLLPPAKPGYIRAKCHYVMHHRRFEAALGILISTNVLIMALEHVDQPSELESVIESTNVIFTAIYCAEVVVKVLGVGTREFLRHPWNRFDTFVAVSSLVGCGFDLLGSDAVINPSVLQAVRVMRVARVVKLLKMATGLASLLTTVWQSMGAVMNLMMLLGILFCAASSLGMKLFGEVECLPADPCFGFSKHANFKNSGLAALTLFRVATGDDWVGIMRDGTRGQHGVVTTVIYFVSFVIIAQFILLNVVVAVLMKNLSAALQWVDVETGETELAATVGIEVHRQPHDTSAAGRADTVEGPNSIESGSTVKGCHQTLDVITASASDVVSLQRTSVVIGKLVRRLSESRLSQVDESETDEDKSVRLKRNRRALKGALHLVMAMVKLMDTTKNSSQNSSSSRNASYPRLGERMSVVSGEPGGGERAAPARRISFAQGHRTSIYGRTSVNGRRSSVAERRSVRLSIRARHKPSVSSGRSSLASNRSSVHRTPVVTNDIN